MLTGKAATGGNMENGDMGRVLTDWVVDLQSRKLIGNPAHGGHQILEMY